VAKRNDGISKIVEDIIKAIVLFLKWLYENIIWAVIVVILANIILLFLIKGGAILAIIDCIVLIVFIFRVWRSR